MSEQTTFFGYCFDIDGYYYPAVTLRNIEEVFNYVNLHKAHFPEMKITDTDDALVLHVKNGLIVWPTEQSEEN